jgi:hypothetical protein
MAYLLQLGYHNGFQANESYLKRKLSYVKLRAQNTLDYFNYYQSNLRFNLDCFAYHYRNHMVESTYWILCNALYCRINIKCHSN